MQSALLGPLMEQNTKAPTQALDEEAQSAARQTEADARGRME